MALRRFSSSEVEPPTPASCPAASASCAICSGDRFDIERPKISCASTSSSGSAGTEEKVNFGLVASPETTMVTVAPVVVVVAVRLR